MSMQIWVRNAAEMKNHGKNNTLEIDLLSKLQNGRPKNFFVHTENLVFFNFFFFIPVKTFLKDHKEPVFNLTSIWLIC